MPLPVRPEGQYLVVRGGKRYELKNHLGNVLAVVSDLKLGQESGTPDDTVDYYEVDLLAMRDYFPFGMSAPDRVYVADGYRYGFNGKEVDGEWKGDGNSLDYGFRVQDPRLGRFLSVDPLAPQFPWYTPYQFAGNTPIWAIDLDGLEDVKVNSPYYTKILARKLMKVQTHEEVRELWDEYRERLCGVRMPAELQEKFGKMAFEESEWQEQLEITGSTLEIDYRYTGPYSNSHLITIWNTEESVEENIQRLKQKWEEDEDLRQFKDFGSKRGFKDGEYAKKHRKGAELPEEKKDLPSFDPGDTITVNYEGANPKVKKIINEILAKGRQTHPEVSVRTERVYGGQGRLYSGPVLYIPYENHEGVNVVDRVILSKDQRKEIEDQ